MYCAGQHPNMSNCTLKSLITVRATKHFPLVINILVIMYTRKLQAFITYLGPQRCATLLQTPRVKLSSPNVTGLVNDVCPSMVLGCRDRFTDAFMRA